MRLLKVTILGTELEAALLNPKVMKKFEDGIKEVVQKANDAKENPVGSEGVEAQCNAVIDFIDDIFGKGSARGVFGEETDLLTCLDAFSELAKMYEMQVNPVIAREYEKIASGGIKGKSGDV